MYRIWFDFYGNFVSDISDFTFRRKNCHNKNFMKNPDFDMAVKSTIFYLQGHRSGFQLGVTTCGIDILYFGCLA
jgi:hypothetical protein